MEDKKAEIELLAHNLYYAAIHQGGLNDEQRAKAFNMAVDKFKGELRERMLRKQDDFLMSEKAVDESGNISLI